MNNVEEASPAVVKVDLVAERRRAKALKVSAACAATLLTFDAQLLDAKMAEMSQEPEGWDENVSLSARYIVHFNHCAPSPALRPKTTSKLQESLSESRSLSNSRFKLE